MRNITFEDISDDRSSTDDTTILDIKSIDISTPGDINITQISLENCTITFLKFSSFSGSTSIKKNVKFDYVNVINAVYTSFNDLMIFGPVYTEDDVDIHFEN